MRAIVSRARGLDAGWIGCAIPIVVTVLVRLHGLPQESAWGDEALTLRHVHHTAPGPYFQAVFREDPRLAVAPVYYGVQYLWTALAGPSLHMQRALSVVLSAITALALYRLTRTIANPAAAGIAAALFALSASMTYFGQEVRFYALLILLATLSTLALSRVLRHGGPTAWIAYIACNTLLFYTHSFAALLFPAQALAVWCHRAGPPRNILVWVVAHAVLAGSFIVSIDALDYNLQSNSQAFVDAFPTPREAVNLALLLAGARFSNLNPAPHLPYGISLEIPAAIAMYGLAAFGVWRLLYRPKPGRANRTAAALLTAWLVVPVGLLYLAAMLWRPFFIDRYVIHGAIPLYILAAVGCANIPRTAPRYALAAALLGALAYQNLALPRPFRPDYRNLAREVTQSQPKHVYALKAFNHLAVRYAITAEDMHIHHRHGYRELIRDAIATAQNTTAPVWAVFHHWNPFAPLDRALLDAEIPHARHTYSGFPPLIAYELNPTRR